MWVGEVDLRVGGRDRWEGVIGWGAHSDHMKGTHPSVRADRLLLPADAHSSQSVLQSPKGPWQLSDVQGPTQNLK